MENNALNRQIAAMRQSFFDEGILGEYFVQIERMSDDDPPFLERLLTTYFRQSTECIATLDQYGIESTSCFNNLFERAIYQLKGSSASIGAIKMCKELDQALQSYTNGNVEGIKIAVERVRNEHTILRNRLEPYFQMMRQAGPSESAVRPK